MLVAKREKCADWLSEIEHPKKRAFLRAYAEGGNATAACLEVGVARVTEWQWRTDPEYVAAKSQAWMMAADKLEAEAFRRGHDGVEEPVFHGGCEVGIVRKFSDTLLIFLLKGAKPDVYRERWQGEISGPGGGPIRTTVDLSKLSEEEIATLERIAARAAESDAPRG